MLPLRGARGMFPPPHAVPTVYVSIHVLGIAGGERKAANVALARELLVFQLGY